MNKLEHWLEESNAKVRSFERAEGLTDGGGHEIMSGIGGMRQAIKLSIEEGCYRMMSLRGNE